MKWLKTWEGYSSQIEGDCEDILQDLVDEGVPFRVFLSPEKVRVSGKWKFETLLKAIIGSSNLHANKFTGGQVDFRPSYWIDNLDQLNSFLQSRGWVYFDPRGVLSTWDEQKRVIMKGRVMDYMEIYFKKI